MLNNSKQMFDDKMSVTTLVNNAKKFQKLMHDKELQFLRVRLTQSNLDQINLTNTNNKDTVQLMFNCIYAQVVSR